jgi:hypothetical protein
MIKIGFIDYYIDEFHANNYPTWIRESSFAGKCDVALAWEELTPKGKKPISEWCREQNVAQASSIEQVVSECDAIVVLSPDNAERHEDLADLPLRSGKPVYVDKPIAPSLAAAQRLFSKAEQFGTPMMSASALRYGSAVEKAVDQMAGSARFVATRGPGVFHIYAIHQVEMLVMALGTGAKRVMHCGNDVSKLVVVDYGDGRRGSINLMPGHPFQLSASWGDDACAAINDMDDFFPRFIEAMLSFFETGASSAPKEQTLEIAAIIEAGNAAVLQPDIWVPVPSAGTCCP